jgi:predicted RNase H-like HicB family nuclease
MIRYPIAIEPGDENTAWGVVAPDLPGCFSAGDTLDKAIDNAKEAIELWLETVLDDEGKVPKPGLLGDHRSNPEFDGWLWAVVEVNPSLVSTRTVRLNVSLPESLVYRIDAYASAHHLTRSGFLAKAALDEMAEN